MDNIDLMNYWIESSDEDYITMQAMRKKVIEILGLYLLGI